MPQPPEPPQPPDPPRRKIAGLTIPEWVTRIIAGVLTAALIAVGSISFALYNDNAAHKKDIAYLLKRDEQVDGELAELRRELRQVKDELMESNAEFHSTAIAKINELLARDHYRARRQ